MLKLLVSALVAGSFPVLAMAQANSTPDAASPAANSTESSGGAREPNFVDRGYFLPRGQFGLTLSAGFTSATRKTEVGITENETRFAGSELGASLNYGILNDLNLGVGVKYTPSFQSENQTTLDKTTSKGMDEPAVALTYRAIKQSQAMPFDFNIGFGYSPKGAVAKSATVSDDGNMARGGDVKTVALGLYRRVSAGEFGLTLTHGAVGELESEDATSGDESKIDARAVTSLSGTAQFEVSEKYYVMAGVGLVRATESKSTDVANTVTTTEAYTSPVFSGSVRIVAVPKTAFVDLGLDVSAAQDIGQTDSIGNSGTIKSVSSAKFTASVQMVF